MTSFRQIEANRLNARRGTGPKSDAGKRRSRRNALRHGLTAEVVIDVLEDPKDYKAFERAVTVEFDAQTAIERELVLRLASLLWRLRRATAIESGLFQMQYNLMRQATQARPGGVDPRHYSAPAGVPLMGVMPGTWPDPRSDRGPTGHKSIPSSEQESAETHGATPTQRKSNAEIACTFQRLTNVDNGAFDRLSRYERTLWRQVDRILWILKILRRRDRRQIRRVNGWRFDSLFDAGA